MARNLENRLSKVERELAQIREGDNEAQCICNAFVGIGPGRVEQFRAEMNRPCPVHGFRELKILHFVSTEPARDLSSPARIIEDPEVNTLLEEYERRLAEAKRAAYRNENDESRFAL